MAPGHKQEEGGLFNKLEASIVILGFSILLKKKKKPVDKQHTENNNLISQTILEPLYTQTLNAANRLMLH